MTSELSEWLALREAADWAARAEALLDHVQPAIARGEPVRVLDLCTGTGSNVRYLMERLAPRQIWLAVDRDAGLLAELPRHLAEWAVRHECTLETAGTTSYLRGRRLHCDIETRQMNLEALDWTLFEGRHLVTASALLDLVSEQWLHVLAQRCRSVGAAALFTLTYNGRSSCQPIEPEDDWILGLFNDHQRTDKGLGGPAAGPDATAIAERAFVAAGYQVERTPSDWSIEPGAAEFQRRLIEGWASAAAEMAPEDSQAIVSWLDKRLAHVAAGRSRIVVHHDDLAAWLMD